MNKMRWVLSWSLAPLFFLLVLIHPTSGLAKQKVPILVYHSIDLFQGHGQKELYVSPEQFEQQMKFLRDNGYTLLTFEDWEQLNHVKKPIFITLDDGYKNNMNVWSIFKKLQSPAFHPKATLFVISDFIGRSNRLNQVNLKEMASSGFFSVQSHTATHPDLTKVKDLDDELGHSKRNIEKITGQPVIAISYPYGSFDQKVIQATKRYYSFGLTTTPQYYVPNGTADDRYELPRIYVKNSTTLDQFAHIVLYK